MDDIFSEHSDDIILDMIDQVYTESLINDTKDIFYNKVPYENGDINLLFIIGYSGGGKSSMSNGQKKFGRDVVDMDKIVFGSSKDDDYFRQLSTFAYSFMTGPGKKYRREPDPKKDNERHNSDSYRKAISVDLIKYAKQYSQAHKSIRLVMEGVWIYRYVDPQDLDRYAVYIKGTSLKTSTERAIKRDNAKMSNEGISKGVQVAKSLGKVLHNIKDALLGNLERYQKYFGPKYAVQVHDKVSTTKKVVNAVKRRAEDTSSLFSGKIKDIVKESEDKEIDRMSDYINEINRLKQLKIEGKIDRLQYNNKLKCINEKYGDDIITETSTEKRVLDRDTDVGAIEDEIRKTDNDDVKKQLKNVKEMRDKEINSDNKDSKDKAEVNESESIKKYENIISRNNDRLSEIMESAASHRNEIQGLNEEIENAEHYLSLTRMYETAALVKSDFYNEAANMEDEIKPIVEALNDKGYKVKYASPGHIKLRKKEDNGKDGVYYGKLYSDARIMFGKKYPFNAPKYWMHREVDNCSYLDIIPINYDKKDGSPDDAFAKWKDSYMNSLRTFVKSLPSIKDAGNVTTEAVDPGLIAVGLLLGTGIIANVVKAYKKAKMEKKWDARIEALRVYPKKHKDCPDISKVKRTKNILSAFDKSKGKAVDDNNDNAPGDYVYTYTLEGKPIVLVYKQGNGYTTALHKDFPSKYSDHAMYLYTYIILYKHNWITPRMEKWLNDEVKENELLKKKNGGKIVDDTDHVKIGKNVSDAKETKESADSDLNDIYTSTSYMDDNIEALLKSNGII